MKRKVYPVMMLKIKIISMGAVYTLCRKVEYCKIVQQFQGSYEGIHYIVYKSGKVIITGMKSEKDFNNKVNGVLLEIELL